MRIKRIELKEFKRFTNLTINLGESPKKIVALVGPNGSGKSSIFDAFEEKQKQYKGAQYNPSSDFLHKAVHVSDTTTEDKKYKRDEAIKIFKQDDTGEFDKKSFYIRTSYRFTPRLGITEMKKQEDVLNDVTRPGSSTEIDGRMRENYERLISSAWDEFWSDDGKTGKDTREELTKKMNDILKEVLDIKISNIGNVLSGEGQLYFEKGVSKKFPYENLSSGEKEVIDIIVDIIVKTKDYNNTVFCIDEPELHLNTAIQRKLLIEIEKLIPESCQLWIATHSIGFLRALQEELREKTSILDFSKDDFDKSATISPMELTRRNWQDIFQTALEDITGLLAPRVIIYCEGRKEPDENGGEQGLDAEIYNAVFSKEHHDVLFVSSGGSTELEKNSSIALAVLSKAFLDVEIFVLKDMDINDDGTPTVEQQRNDWLAVNQNGRMLIRKEIENYVFDFEIIHKAYPDVTEDEYEKIIIDIADEDVKSKAGDMMVLCGVNTGMSADDFKKHLSAFIAPDTEVYKELKEVVFGGS